MSVKKIVNIKSEAVGAGKTTSWQILIGPEEGPKLQ